jgi:predicted outer membrane repeat protein
MGFFRRVVNAVRVMRSSNPVFTIYWLGMASTCLVVTVWLIAILSYTAILTFALFVYSSAIFAGGALYGKGTLRNAARALGLLLRLT